MVNYKEYISIDANVRFGKPVISDTRISVYDVLRWFANGMDIKDIIHDFPELNENQIKACLAYAARQWTQNKYSFIKLLFDQNISFGIISKISVDFPEENCLPRN